MLRLRRGLFYLGHGGSSSSSGCNVKFSTVNNTLLRFYHSSNILLLTDQKTQYPLVESINNSSSQYYLHISPSGDYWFGAGIFAAKHLQPDYLKSIPIPAADSAQKSHLEEQAEEFMSNASIDVLHRIYDEGCLPDEFYCNAASNKNNTTNLIIEKEEY